MCLELTPNLLGCPWFWGLDLPKKQKQNSLFTSTLWSKFTS